MATTAPARARSCERCSAWPRPKLEKSWSTVMSCRGTCHACSPHTASQWCRGTRDFSGLTVHEIFALGMWSAGVPREERDARVEWVVQVLPPVRHFYTKRAGLLSEGQQQMVSIGRALLARPHCLMMDEPSIGLAPKLFQDLLQPIRVLQQQRGMSILLIEQNVREALRISGRVDGWWSSRRARLSSRPLPASLMELY